MYKYLVLNHTSSQHPWFIESKGANMYGTSSKYKDWYVYSNQKLNGYYQLTSNLYYEGAFWSEMPDLNMDSESLREEVTNDLEYDIKKIDMISFSDYIIYKHNRYMKDAGKLFLHDNSKKRLQIDIKYSYKMELLIASYIIKKINDKTKLLRKIKK